MLFNSYVFIFAFLPVVYLIFRLLQKRNDSRWVVAWLVLASLFYYGWWKPAFLLLLGVSIASNTLFGKLLCGGLKAGRLSRKTVLLTGIVFNLGLLGYFKYCSFFIENLNWGFGTNLLVPQIILPIGISFITFQKIGFLVDAFRGEVREFRFLDFALFVTFFPQLIAGPIVHHKEVMPQFAMNRFSATAADFATGLSIFAFGLFKKVIVADSCAVYSDAGYSTLSAGGTIDMASAWVTAVAFSFQLYYDFSGYSDMAVGLARIFGIRFPVNFHSPYKASGIVDFWRRWHITLSRFLRDYLYFPLGGSHRGHLRQYVNLTVVMLLGGLWHGAQWTFVLWGALHGLGLAINHGWTYLSFSKRPFFSGPVFRAFSVCFTFILVTLAWIPFRAETMAIAGQMFASLWASGQDGLMSFGNFFSCQFSDPDRICDLMTWFTPREMWPESLPADFVATYRPAGFVILGVALATFFLPNTNEIFARFNPVLGMESRDLLRRSSVRALNWKVAMAVSFALFLALLQLNRVSPFLYYQF